jgi:hypothetical protein
MSSGIARSIFNSTILFAIAVGLAIPFREPAVEPRKQNEINSSALHLPDEKR